jgi:hypothetical protein
MGPTRLMPTGDAAMKCQAPLPSGGCFAMWTTCQLHVARLAARLGNAATPKNLRGFLGNEDAGIRRQSIEQARELLRGRQPEHITR